MKYIVSILVLITVISSCHTNADTKSTTADSTIGKKPQGYEVKQLAGVFNDTLPCADCPGIAAKVYLKPDLTFVMENQYIGKSISYQTGTWQLNDSLLQLSGTSDTQHFKIANYAEIDMLDKEGKEITGPKKKLALYRNNTPFKPQQPVPVQGMYSAKGDTMLLHVCSMNHDYQATLAPAAMALTAKYKGMAKEGQPVFAKLAGHFELRPSINDTTTQDYFVIEKFISFDAKGACK